jgi:hypothetical protein
MLKNGSNPDISKNKRIPFKRMKKVWSNQSHDRDCVYQFVPPDDARDVIFGQ